MRVRPPTAAVELISAGVEVRFFHRTRLWYKVDIVMFIANSASARIRLAAALMAGVLVCVGDSRTQAQAPAAKDGASEFQESLFVLNPHAKGANGVEVPGVLAVVSVPQPIQKYCMGKTSEECATIDYCIRTTTKGVAMCQKLPPNLKNLPPYPAGMRPNRQFSISFSQGAPGIKGFDTLRSYFDHAPKGSLDRLSTHARFQARVRFTRTAEDGNFELLEVLSTPAE